MAKFDIRVSDEYIEITDFRKLENLKHIKNPLINDYIAYIKSNRGCMPLICNEWLVEFDMKNEGTSNDDIKSQLTCTMKFLIDTYGDAINLFSDEDLQNIIQSFLINTTIKSMRNKGAVRGLSTEFADGTRSPINIIIDNFEEYTDKEMGE